MKVVLDLLQLNKKNSYLLPLIGTIASEWSELLMWKPRIYSELAMMAKDSYCSQRVPSLEGMNPVVQAQVFLLSGFGRHRCGQPPLLELQAFDVPAESEVGQKMLLKRIIKFLLFMKIIAQLYQ